MQWLKAHILEPGYLLSNADSCASELCEVRGKIIPLSRPHRSAIWVQYGTHLIGLLRDLNE